MEYKDIVPNVIAALAVLVAIVSVVFAYKQFKISVDALTKNLEAIKQSSNISNIIKMRDYYMDYLNNCMINPDLYPFEIDHEKLKENNLSKSEILSAYKIFLLIDLQFAYDKEIQSGRKTARDWKDWFMSVAANEKAFNSWVMLRFIFETGSAEMVEFIDECFIEESGRREKSE